MLDIVDARCNHEVDYDVLALSMLQGTTIIACL